MHKKKPWTNSYEFYLTIVMTACQQRKSEKKFAQVPRVTGVSVVERHEIFVIVEMLYYIRQALQMKLALNQF